MSPSQSRQVRRADARRKQAKNNGSTRAPGGPKGRPPGGPGLLSRVSKNSWLALAAVVVVVVVVVVILAGGSSSGSAESSLLTGSGYANTNTSNTRYVGGPIDSSNVTKLESVWSLPITTKSEYGSYSSAPVISNGVVFSQDLDSNVQAINLKTGKVIWTKTYESPDQGPNGLVVQGGMVYGATTNNAFALNEKTGEQVWSVTLARNEHEGIDMAPAITKGSSTSRPYRATPPSSTRAKASASCGRSMARPARSCGTSTPCRKTSGPQKTSASTPGVACGTHRPSTLRATCT